MNTPITIGISACLFGQNTRYDGGLRREQGLLDRLTDKVVLMPLCPEAECGLGIPREPMQLEGDSENPRLMTITTRRDLTDRMQTWIDQRLAALTNETINGLILKARSPSCGKQVAVHGPGEPASGPGLFARACQQRFPGLPIADEEELRDPARLADFLKRVVDHAQNTQENPK
ncbi:MAG: DUF523 domain-containing protein [Deltaproteobacteria bacterium]|nr:DUF523 domain-containing protein [Deltaproteobacteria bacterium]